MECRHRAEPFDTLESTQEFMALLQQSISETLGDLEQDLISARASTGQSRRAQAVQLALFKLNQLRSHVFATERLLKDLRTLRGLLCKDVRQSQTENTAIPDACGIDDNDSYSDGTYPSEIFESVK